MKELASLDKIPPQSLDAELSTLGSMMVDRSAVEKVLEILKPEDFYREANQTVCSAIMDLAERNEAVDLVTVAEELRRRGKLDMIGGLSYLTSLIESVPTSVNVEHYARIVEEKSILRRLISASAQISSWAYGEEEPADEVVDHSEHLIFSIGQRHLGEYFTPIKPLLDQALEEIDKVYQDKTITTGISTGFDSLNLMTSGLQKSELIIVAARPSMGKTALCLNMAATAALKGKVPTAIFSLEMSKEQLAMRMICSEARVDAHRVRTGYLTTDEWRRLVRAVERLYDAPIYIDDTAGISPMEMRGKCRRLKAEAGIGFVLVDYLQLMHGFGRSENRNQEISEVARSLKSLAKEMSFPVVAAAQLSRAVERRDNKRPMLSDLRESGSIEQEADVVMFIHREDYYHRGEGDDQAEAERLRDELSEDGSENGARQPKAEKTELIIAKQRNGPVGSVEVNFFPAFARFENIDWRFEEEA